MGNLSFETAHATNQGEAADWTVNCTADSYIGLFNATIPTSWSPEEGFESTWFMPALVHFAADTANEVTGADATDEASAITLANEIRVNYLAHLQSIGNIHDAQDLSNLTALGQAVDASSLYDLLSDVTEGLKYLFNKHALNESATLPHWKVDTQNAVTAADATDTATAVTLVNDIKAIFNTHIALTSYGLTNESSLMEFAAANLDTAEFETADDKENFEHGFAIPDLLSLANQAQMVHRDTTSVSWPTGHFNFEDTWDYLSYEHAIADNMEQGWKLPGSLPQPNHTFFNKYWDSTEEEFSFDKVTLIPLLETGITESFESGWRSNDVGLAKYWTGTEWRFIDWNAEAGAQLADMHCWPFQYGSLNFLTDVANLTPSHVFLKPPYSTECKARITTATSGIVTVQMQFYDATSISRTCYWHFDTGDLELNDTISDIGLTDNPADPRYEFTAAFNGIIRITDLRRISPVTGTAVWEGYGNHVEDFESNWVLTLEESGGP